MLQSTTTILTRRALITLVLVVFCCVFSLVHSHQSFKVYRGLQYDRTLNRLELGVRRTGINNALPISTISTQTINDLINNNSSSLPLPTQRSVLVIHLEALLASLKNSSTSIVLDHFLSHSNRNAQWLALIIVFPAKMDETVELAEKNLAALKELELFILTRSIEKPIYFVQSESELEQLLNRVTLGDDNLQLTVNEKEATALAAGVKLVNLYGTLNGKSASSRKASTSNHQERLTVAVVANYDTLAAAPEVTRGMASTASSVVGLLELARVFKGLYSTASTRGSYDLIFVLTSAGRLGYEGSRNWLKNLSPSIRNNLLFVLCLENIAGSKLNIHITQKTNDENVVRLFKEFSSSAKNMNVPLQFSQKALAAGKEASWEHEIFARKKIHAATVSSVLKSTPQRLRTSTFDLTVNQTIVEQNIKLIADALAKFIYGEGNDVASKIRLSDHYIKSNLDLLSQHSRALPFTTSTSPFIEAMRNVMKQTFAGRVQEDEFELGDRVYKFYGTPTSTMNVYQVQPMTFNLLLIVPTVAYLGLLWFLLAPMRTRSNE